MFHLVWNGTVFERASFSGVEKSSLYPFLVSLGVLLLVIMGLFSLVGSTHVFTGAGFLLLLVIGWGFAVVRESAVVGFSSFFVVGARVGFILFILSEVLFFFSFFWMFFYSSVGAGVSLGEFWPPVGITPILAWGVPVLNTLLLLSSGVAVTMFHNSIIQRGPKVSGLLVAVFLGVLFLLVQFFEYNGALFSFGDSVFGSSFFLLTGFHGGHVLVGCVLLLACLMRVLSLSFHSHVGVECAIWYWHFVDVVWLFLFVFVYLWGSLVCVR